MSTSVSWWEIIANFLEEFRIWQLRLSVCLFQSGNEFQLTSPTIEGLVLSTARSTADWFLNRPGISELRRVDDAGRRFSSHNLC